MIPSRDTLRSVQNNTTTQRSRNAAFHTHCSPGLPQKLYHLYLFFSFSLSNAGITNPGSQHFNLIVFSYLIIWTSNKLQGNWCPSLHEATKGFWVCHSVHTGRKNWLRLGSYRWSVICVYYCNAICFLKEEKKETEMTLWENCFCKCLRAGVVGSRNLWILLWFLKYSVLPGTQRSGNLCIPPLVSEWPGSSTELRGNSQGGRRNREETEQVWCSETPQQRWQKENRGHEGGAENNVRKSPGRGAVGMEMWRCQPWGRSIVLTSRRGQLSWW